MEFCKVARHICQTQSRGYCQKAEAVHEPGWSKVLASLEEHVTGVGKALLPALKLMITTEIGCLKELRGKDKAQLEDLKERIADLKQLKVIAELNVLRLQGLNNILGLFEKMQEQLTSLTTSRKGLRGTDLWEAILKNHAPLGACIEQHTNLRASDVPKQAFHVYQIYTILSQHADNGKVLAELQAHTAGTIVFQRGPMSLEQVRIFQCMGDAVGFDIAEDPGTW